MLPRPVAARAPAWGVDYLGTQLDDGVHIVLESPKVKETFIHYQDGPDGRDARSYHDHSTRELRLSWRDYRSRCARNATSPYRCYLQSLLCAPGHSTATTPTLRLKQMKWRAMGADLATRVASAGPPLDRLAAVGDFGPLNVSNLFVSDAGATSPLHYDEYDNVFLQLAGRKRVSLAPPGTRARPWPVHHPQDAYAKTTLDDLDGPSDVVVLEAGDALFIPSHWWHVVETLDDGCVSLNYWFQNAAPAPPRGNARLPDHLKLDLSRHVEHLLAQLYGPKNVRAFLLDLLDELHGNAPDVTPGARPPDFLAVQNFLLHRLSALLGPRRVAAFVAHFLDPSRFDV